MANPAEMRTLTAQCYCKSAHFTVTLPAASLPLGVHLCHCSVCRYTHGTLCIFHAVLPPGVQPQFVAPSSVDKLTGYTHAASKSERLFCSTCGCHVGDRSIEGETEGEWNVASSLFTEHGEDVFLIRTHCLTKCAPGSGLHEWLPKMGDREMRVWNPEPDNADWDMTVVESEPEFDAAGNERLRAQCHCGGVSFTIPRPTIPEVTEVPYLSKWTSPVDPNKWVAILDLCDDCRLMDGTHVIGWTFVPRTLLDPPMPRDLRNYGTLKAYSSSEGVTRGFCGVCGATAVYSCEDRNPSEGEAVVDISVGILRAPEGVSAENWLTWRTGRIGWAESGQKYSDVFARSLADGFAKWGEKKHGKALDFIVD